MKKHIPNTLTALNLFCGCLAITQISNNNYVFAAILVLLGAFFDFFDGMAARLLKVSSPIGAQLDSLADMVTFGVVPAYLAFSWLNDLQESPINYLAFLIAIFSGVRLAKFNVDTRQSTSFIGLPTPANALFWIAIPLVYWQIENVNWLIKVDFLTQVYQSSTFILAASIIFSYLLVAELPLLALKFKSWGWKGNEFRLSLLLISFLLIAIFLFAAIPFILILYVILSIIQTQSSKKNEVQS